MSLTIEVEDEIVTITNFPEELYFAKINRNGVYNHEPIVLEKVEDEDTVYYENRAFSFDSKKIYLNRPQRDIEEIPNEIVFISEEIEKTQAWINGARNAFEIAQGWMSMAK